METDNFFRKNKAKSTKKLERRGATRSSYKRVLIVCEGEKTEPNYFNELISCYKLNTENVEVDGTCGSSPQSVFKRALELYQKQERKGDTFDKVYCLFDKDKHDTYKETLSKISNQKSKKVFHAITSVPCFEYWILLHFNYSTKPYNATGSSSICDEVLKDLRKFFPEYTKGNKGIFKKLSKRLETAKSNAERALRDAETSHTDNPTTRIHYLVDCLQNLKKI